MGQKHSEPVFFSSEEQEFLRDMYMNLEKLGFPDVFINGIYKMMETRSFIQFVSVSRRLVSGSNHDKMCFFQCVGVEFDVFVSVIIGSFERILNSLYTGQVSNDSIAELESFIKIKSFSSFDHEGRVYYTQFEDLVQNSIYIQRIWTFLFLDRLCPKRLPEPTRLADTSCILDSRMVFVLDTQIQSIGVKSRRWTRLYSTESNGKNWTTFYSKLAYAQSSILVIRDTKGCVFGGFASCAWKCSSRFYGDSRCFLFGSPEFGLFNSSGINLNYMYCNQGTQSLPNGIGFGGQVNSCDLVGLFRIVC
jgi:hypothetical protein